MPSLLSGTAGFVDAQIRRARPGEPGVGLDHHDGGRDPRRRRGRGIAPAPAASGFEPAATIEADTPPVAAWCRRSFAEDA